MVEGSISAVAASEVITSEWGNSVRTKVQDLTDGHKHDGIGSHLVNRDSFHYVISESSGDFFIFDNRSKTYYLENGAFADLIGDFNTLATYGESFFFENGTYEGSYVTPFTVALNQPITVCGEHPYYTYIRNYYSGGSTFKITNGAWSAYRQVKIENMRVGAASSGIAIDCDQESANHAPPVSFRNLKLYFPLIGIRIVNPVDFSAIENVFVRTAGANNARGLIIANNDAQGTPLNRGNFVVNNYHVMGDSDSYTGIIGVLITGNYETNTGIINMLTLNDIFYITGGTSDNTDSIGVKIEGPAQCITIINPQQENVNTAYYLDGDTAGAIRSIKLLGCGYHSAKFPTASPHYFWRAVGEVEHCVVEGAWVQYGDVKEDERTNINYDMPNIFRDCYFNQAFESHTITPTRATRFDNCGPNPLLTGLNCPINGYSREAAGVGQPPTNSYYLVGDIIENTSDSTVWVKYSNSSSPYFLQLK